MTRQIPAIDVNNVTKEYGEVIALNNLDITIKREEIYGFLGPNGAGKSTTIDLLLDFVRPTKGNIEVLGYDAQSEPIKVRRSVGFLPDSFSIYDRLTGQKHVEFAIKSKPDADEEPLAVLERVGIAEVADRKAGGYSKGMKQRLALGMALAGKPDLLILDEPSTGLDPNGAREMRKIIREERDRGATVFFSSHILEQVDAVCDRVGILRNGELVAEDTVERLRNTIGEQATLTVTVDSIPPGAAESVQDIDGVSEVELHGQRISITCGDEAKHTVLNTLEDAGAVIENFDTEPASLEELFVHYTRNQEVDE